MQNHSSVPVKELENMNTSDKKIQQMFLQVIDGINEGRKSVALETYRADPAKAVELFQTCIEVLVAAKVLKFTYEDDVFEQYLSRLLKVSEKHSFVPDLFIQICLIDEQMGHGVLHDKELAEITASRLRSAASRLFARAATLQYI